MIHQFFYFNTNKDKRLQVRDENNTEENKLSTLFNSVVRAKYFNIYKANPPTLPPSVRRGLTELTVFTTRG